jgi:hypothetical protein
MKRRCWVALALAIGAALAIPATSGAQIPTQDSATGQGNTLSFKNIEFAFTSGPSGENPTGFSSFFVSLVFGGPPVHFTASSPGCMHVEGNTATVAGPIDANPLGHPYGKLTVVDNGPADSGLDTFAPVSGFQPFDCSTANVLNQQNLIDGDIVVVDAQPLPTTLAQCMKGGWQSFDVFKNEGDCISFVATDGDNAPAGT